jgi:hypothetical protein
VKEVQQQEATYQKRHQQITVAVRFSENETTPIKLSGVSSSEESQSKES